MNIEQAAEEYFNQRNCPFGLKDLETFHYAANWALSHQWISVDDELPEEYEDVLVRFIYHEKSVVSIGRYSDMGEWMVNGFGFLNHITHWMEIPPLSEGGGG